MSKEKNRYMELLDVKDQASAVDTIQKRVSNLSPEEHLIRSCIFDLHAVIETELRRIYFFHFQTLLPLTNDKENNKKIKARFEKMIEGRSFGDMWRVLKPVILEWYKDFESIEEINNVRNKAAHGAVDKVIYKNRNPFKDPDCLCQMLCDVEGINECMGRFFSHMRKPIWQCRAYYERYGDIGISREIIDEVGRFYDEL
jgi:hypothetical protein